MHWLRRRAPGRAGSTAGRAPGRAGSTAGRAPSYARTGAADRGFTLVEVMVSMAVLGIVMTALTTFFVSTGSILNYQRGKQIAVRLAQDGAERVRAMPGSSLESLAALPADVITVNDQTYQRRWRVEPCWQPQLAAACGTVQQPSYLPFFRVTVEVTWPDPKWCARGCSYSTATLVSTMSPDPIFNPKGGVRPPAINNPGNQTGQVNIPITPLDLTATSEAPPLSWSAVSLPPGLNMAADGHITGTPTTAGTYVVRVIATDQLGQSDASFTWTVVPPPKVTPPGNQQSQAGGPASAQLLVTGGTGPYVWAVTGLPTGLSVDPLTGLITGSTMYSGPPAVVTATVTDKYGQTNSVTFTWKVTLNILYPFAGPAYAKVGDNFNLQAIAAGGTGGYTWSTKFLTPGLKISSGGLITGNISAGGHFDTVLTVTDSSGDKYFITIAMNVATDDLRVTSPSGDQTSAVNVNTSLTAAASGGATGNTWTATGLPTGLSIAASTGTMSGRPTVKGPYSVTLTVTDGGGTAASFTFKWTIL